jgi:AcrR family transcriptional regulator
MGVRERRVRDKESLRRRILDAAREVFVQEGYEQFSMRKVSNRIEYSPGTIYLHFRDKSALLDTLVNETFEKLNKKLVAIRKDQGDSIECLRRGLGAYIQFGLEHPQDYLVTFVIARDHSEILASDILESSGMRCFENLTHLLSRCAEEGRLESNDTIATGQALWAAIHGLTSLLITKCRFPFVEEKRLVGRQIEILIQGVVKK